MFKRNTYTPPKMDKQTAYRITGAANDSQLASVVGFTRQYVHSWPEESIPEIGVYRVKLQAGLVLDVPDS